MAATSLLAILRFGLIICFTLTTTQARNDDDKDDKGNIWDKSPPPAGKCPPPPSPPPRNCPPPPPKCNPGCIPAPPPCRSKSCCAKCCPPHKRSPPPKDSKPPRKGSKRPPPKKDDDHLTDEDVSNLNDLLNLQLLLSNIYLKANTGLKKQRPGSKVDQTSGDDDEQQELVSRVFDQFSTTSIQQTSSLISELNQTSQDLNINITDIANLSGGVNQAFNGSLNPQFNAEDSPMTLLLAVQSIGPSLLASVATSILPNLESTRAITLVSSILPVAAGQDSSMRTILFMQRDAVVEPYNLTVSEFMQRTNTMFRSMAREQSDNQPDNFLSIVRLTIGMSARSATNFLNGVLGLVG